MAQSAPLQIKQQFTPALSALAVAISKVDDFLPTPFVRPDKYQNTLFFLGHSRTKVDSIRPDIDEPTGAEIAPLLVILLVPPVRFKP